MPKPNKWFTVALTTIGSILLVESFAAPASATLIADFRADYQSTTPKTGWAYQHAGGGAGAIGSEGYANLVYYAGPQDWYSSDGSLYGTFNLIGVGTPSLTTNFIHPGDGAAFTVAQFTLSTSGYTSIDAIFLHSQQDNSNGVELFANVNTGPDLIPLAYRIVPGAGDYTGPTSIDLGYLNAGDRIYVALGSNGDYQGDSSNLQFQINQVVPEPASLGLLAAGATLGLLRRKRD